MTYPGKKSNSGIIQFLVNNIPLHRRYFELFAGTGHLFFNKRPATENHLNDIDRRQYEYLLSKKRSSIDTFTYNQSFFSIIEEFDFTGEDFVYLDPPYPFESRRQGRAYYRHEMPDEDHVKLLELIKGIPANVMISTRPNDLYSTVLKDWRAKEFQTVDRVGPVTEIIYMNYPEPAFLHQYDQLGGDFTDRQRVRRKVNRFAAKIEALPAYEKHLFLQQMIANDPSAVKMFLSMMPAL